MDSPMAAPAIGLSRKRPRHFQQGPDETEEEQRVEIAAAAQPPVTRLYRHALESIFAFLSFKELSSVLGVSRLWSSAVVSMHAIDGAVSFRSNSSGALPGLCASRLVRHIGTLGSGNAGAEFNRELLDIAAMRLTGLHTLFYLSPSPFELPQLFPPTLTLLDLSVHSAVAMEANSLISVVSCLPRLRSLALNLPSPIQDDVSFAPLARLADLEELKFHFDFELLPRQAEEIRALSHLTSLDTCLWEEDVSQLLRAPHQLQWQKLQIWHIDEEAQLLASLPSLTDLAVVVWMDLAILQHVPNLRTLKLEDFHDEWPLPSSEQILQGLGQCTQITSLTIEISPLTAKHMSTMLSCLPALSRLELTNMYELESLSFLSSEPLQRSLTDLALKWTSPLPVAEVEHMFALQQLTHLSIHDCLSEKLNSSLLRELTPPSARLPKLVKSVIRQ